MLNRRKFLFTTGAALVGSGAGYWYWCNRWRYIVIHHSAGNYGSIEFLQQVHRQRQADDLIDAIPYHFVIGNGNGLQLGAIASDWRQRYHLWGTHVSARNWQHNWRGIGICLVGNFEQHPVPPAQYRALVGRTQTVMQQYGINAEHVNGHGRVPGESTLCPGQHFPWQKFMQDIA